MMMMIDRDPVLQQPSEDTYLCPTAMKMMTMMMVRKAIKIPERIQMMIQIRWII